MEFRDEGASVCEDVAGDTGVLYGCNAREGIGQYGDGGDFSCEGGAMGRDVDSEGESADDAESRETFGEPVDESAAHGLSVGSCLSGSDHRETVQGERLDISLDIQDRGIIGHFAQQGRVFGIGRCDDPDVVSLAVFDFAGCGGESLTSEELPGDFGSEFGFSDEFVNGRCKDASGIAEGFEQVHGPFYADPGSHLQGNILDGHTVSLKIRE